MVVGGASAARAAGSTEVPDSPATLPVHRRGSQELQTLTRLAFDELGGLAAGIGQVHRGVADRAFGTAGPGARPARLVHDALARRVYGTLRAGTRLAGRAAGVAIEQRGIGDGRPLSSTPRGSAIVAAITGLIGDTLEAEGSVLAAPMAVRVDGEVVPPQREALAAAFPAATGRLVVFVHGLMETEFAWRLGAGPDGETYGERLARDLGVTPVDVRYNTGRHISHNGRSLAELLEEVVAGWPVEVERVALVGHSMGGLVARSACHIAQGDGMAWVSRVRHVVSLGSPHLGAPLSGAVHWASAALSALPETRPFGSFLRRRSAGIRDLRNGSLVDDDWRDADPDALRAAACAEVPLIEGAAHHFVAATVTRSPDHPLGRLVGDWLVLGPSACGTGRSRRVGFRDEDGLRLGGAHHLALLNHPQVYASLRQWLAREPAALSG